MVRVHEGKERAIAIRVMKSFDRAHWIKIAILAVYVLIISGSYLFLFKHGIPMRAVPRMFQHAMADAGAFGPLALIAFYIASTIIPFPTVAIAVAGGALFGPWLGTISVILGLNIAAGISFWIGRYFGRHLISENERGWVKKYDDVLSEQGFVSVLFMRLLFFPFDVVSIGSGMTRMPFRQYMLGSFIGCLPSTISFVVLGKSFSSPRTWVLFAILMAISIAIAFALRRSKWAKKYIFVQPVLSPQDFEKDV